ncbi:MAG: signal recognition particle protein [Candidatus Cloacimonadota bacterium]|nr:MAG: signal recognition particle protein [Candidatus Cloacimonadota bacterium]
MMFGDLSERLDGIFRKMKGQGKLTESNIKESLREVRRALLEADVNFKVAKEFIKSVQEKAIGEEVLKSLKPGHQVVKIVNEELIKLMGSDAKPMIFHQNKLNKIMLVGLQGSGKTTACSKLSVYFRKKKNKPCMAACDIYRPAAIHQLQVLGKQLNVPVISHGQNDVISIAEKAISFAEKNFNDLIIFDTAGRLHIDEKLMQELKDLKEYIKPDFIFFVADAMTGQDAVTVAKEFYEQLEFDGVILTKMDGDSRGGAALSIRRITGKPIVFIGTGERPNDLEEFHAERMASRILGMGDILSLIERAEQVIDEEEAERMAKRLAKNQFTFSDFLKQLQQIKKMGPLEQLLKMIPGINSKALKDINLDGKELKRVEAIIYSMTVAERDKPQLLNGSRRLRIAKGSGTSVQEVNKLVKQFDQMKRMLKQFNNPGKGRPKMRMPF